MSGAVGVVTVEVLLGCLVVFAFAVAGGIVGVRGLSRLLYGRWRNGPPVVLGALAVMAAAPLGWFPPGWIVGGALLALPCVQHRVRRLPVLRSRDRP
jgi:hypothetical protein